MLDVNQVAVAAPMTRVVDPVTTEIVRNGVVAITEEMKLS